MPPRKSILQVGRSRRESSGAVVDRASFDKSAFIIKSVVEPEAGIRDDVIAKEAPVQVEKTRVNFSSFGESDGNITSEAENLD